MYACRVVATEPVTLTYVLLPFFDAFQLRQGSLDGCLKGLQRAMFSLVLEVSLTHPPRVIRHRVHRLLVELATVLLRLSTPGREQGSERVTKAGE